MESDPWLFGQSILAILGIVGFFWLLAFGIVGTYFRGNRSLKSVAKVSIFWGLVFLVIATVVLWIAWVPGNEL